MSKDTVKCYKCDEQVKKSEMVSYKHATESNPKGINRNFHPHCYKEHRENQKEREEMEPVYRYIKDKLFSLDEGKRFPDKHLVTWLQSLKTGEMVKRGSKVFGVGKGYPYEVILLALKVKKIDIVRSVHDKSKNFKSDTNRLDYMFSIVISVLNDVYDRYLEKQKIDKDIKEKDYSRYNLEEKEYKDKSNIKNNKVANLLNDLW